MKYTLQENVLNFAIDSLAINWQKASCVPIRVIRSQVGPDDQPIS